jgi:hypothetical protein
VKAVEVYPSDTPLSEEQIQKAWEQAAAPSVVADEFMRIAGAEGDLAAASYLGCQTPWVGHRAVSLILARLSKSQQVKS